MVEQPPLKSSIFFWAKQTTRPLPDQSLAARQDTSATAGQGVLHPCGVRWDGEEVFESVVYSEYHEMAVSLLIFSNEPACAPSWLHEVDEEAAVVGRGHQILFLIIGRSRTFPLPPPNVPLRALEKMGVRKQS